MTYESKRDNQVNEKIDYEIEGITKKVTLPMFDDTSKDNLLWSTREYYGFLEEKVDLKVRANIKGALGILDKIIINRNLIQELDIQIMISTEISKNMNTINTRTWRWNIERIEILGFSAIFRPSQYVGKIIL